MTDKVSFFGPNAPNAPKPKSSFKDFAGKFGDAGIKAGKSLGKGLYKAGSHAVHAAHQHKLLKIEEAKARKEAGLSPKRPLALRAVKTGTDAVNYHRARRLAKLTYQNERAKQIGSLQEQRELNKAGRPVPPGIRPLGDKQFNVNPSKRLNAGIRKVKGTNPLSDKGLNKKINLNKSNGAFFKRKM